MIGDSDRGFTIIEVILFLAVTGALFAALMVGVNNGITQQRYSDSVNNYKALLQNQYAEVVSTRNENNRDWTCNVDGSVTLGSTSSRGTRGTSECVILGRVVTVSADGKQVTTSSVTGRDPSTPLQGDELDTAVLTAYQPHISAYDSESTDIDWGGNLSPATSQPLLRTILILRSPTSGLIRVFTSKNKIVSVDLASMNSTAVSTNCIMGDSGLLPKQVIKINPTIAGPDAVTTRVASGGVCA